jgi:hypothetical protein
MCGRGQNLGFVLHHTLGGQGRSGQQGCGVQQLQLLSTIDDIPQATKEITVLIRLFIFLCRFMSCVPSLLC